MILQLLDYEFIQRAYIAGSFVAISCAMLGIFLTLNRLSLIGDGLSHVSFGAIALGLFLGIYPLYVAVPIVITASYFISRLKDRAGIFGDSAIGIVSSFSISAGVIFASLSGGFNIDLFSYLFGNILAISTQEVYLSFGISIISFCIIMFFYNDLFSVTFDEQYAKISGIETKKINIILTFLTAITVVIATKIVGIMLVSSFLILPAVTALRISKEFRTAIAISMIISVFSVLSGITISFYADLPAGATIVMMNFILFILSMLWI